jgi:hypothetical protein
MLQELGCYKKMFKIKRNRDMKIKKQKNCNSKFKTCPKSKEIKRKKNQKRKEKKG